MLNRLTIQNLSLIEEVDLHLRSGLIVFTGETGAGKTMLLDALELSIGAPARAELLRSGSEQLSVRAEWLLEGTLCVIERTVSAQGKSQQSVDGKSLTLKALRQLMGERVNFTAQHAQSQLLEGAGQLAYVDAFCGVWELRALMAKQYALYQEALFRIERLEKAELLSDVQKEWMQFQVAEIRRVQPGDNELATLKEEHRQLLMKKRMQDALALVTQLLAGDRGDPDALSLLRDAKSALVKCDQSDLWQAQLNQLAEAQAVIEDVAVHLERYSKYRDSHDSRIREIEERVSLLSELLRKHKRSEAELIVYQTCLEKSLADASQHEDNYRMAKKELAELKAQCQEVADRLSVQRRAALVQLETAVSDRLRELGMPQAVFQIRAENKPLSELGCDAIEMVFSANPGEEVRALAKIASGGELSRITLALKSVSMPEAVALSVFDEIDTGVGGRLAHALGQQLRAVAQKRQVFCITHLPAIAAMADSHYLVEKHVCDNRTSTRVRLLNEAEKVEELARMLSGKTVTAITREHAREVLQKAMS